MPEWGWCDLCSGWFLGLRQGAAGGIYDDLGWRLSQGWASGDHGVVISLGLVEGKGWWIMDVQNDLQGWLLRVISLQPNRIPKVLSQGPP
jgi:hypothetical protein